MMRSQRRRDDDSCASTVSQVVAHARQIAAHGADGAVGREATGHPLDEGTRSADVYQP
jgi:hypothetical protein